MSSQRPETPKPRATGPAVSREVSEAVLERLRAGDISALEAVVHAYGDRVFSVCLGLLRHRSDAEDAAQEVFLRAFQQADKFSGRSLYSTWLLRLATNHTLNLRKAAQRKAAASEPLSDVQVQAVAAGLAPDQIAMRREYADRVAALLQELPVEHRQVLVLREMEGLSYVELAEVLGVPVGTVTSRLIRGRQKLRLLMDEARLQMPDAD